MKNTALEVAKAVILQNPDPIEEYTTQVILPSKDGSVDKEGKFDSCQTELL